MKVVILAGGLGTRMREETEFRPKPMVEVGSRPIIWHIMKNFAHFGFNNDFTVKLGTQELPIIHGEHEELGWSVTVANTGSKTMTGGRVHKLRKYLNNEPFIVTYGDSLANVDISSLVRQHQESKSLATVTMVRPTSRFGVLEIDETMGKVLQFREKPVVDGWINIGFFVMEPKALDFISAESVLEEEPLEKLASSGQLSYFKHEGFWQPMDTYREYRLMNDLWDKGNPPWQVF
jgi:glucose-1-phosphate cytidylyltransferase